MISTKCRKKYSFKCPIKSIEFRRTKYEASLPRRQPANLENCMIYFDKPYFAVRYNPVLRCAIQQCKGYFLQEEYQEAMRQGLEVVRQTGATALIVDLHAVRDEESWDADWTATRWFPQIIQTDVRKLAVVVPFAALPHLTSLPIQCAVADQLLIGRFFADPEEALQWIQHLG